MGYPDWLLPGVLLPAVMSRTLTSDLHVSGVPMCEMYIRDTRNLSMSSRRLYRIHLVSSFRCPHCVRFVQWNLQLAAGFQLRCTPMCLLLERVRKCARSHKPMASF